MEVERACRSHRQKPRVQPQSRRCRAAAHRLLSRGMQQLWELLTLGFAQSLCWAVICCFLFLPFCVQIHMYLSWPTYLWSRASCPVAWAVTKAVCINHTVHAYLGCTQIQHCFCFLHKKAIQRGLCLQDSGFTLHTKEAPRNCINVACEELWILYLKIICVDYTWH